MKIIAIVLPFLVLSFFCIPAMASTVLQCIGLYTLMKNRGMARPWLGAVPFVNLYALGLLADNIQYFRGRRTTYRYWMVAYLAAVLANMVFSILNSARLVIGSSRSMRTFLPPLILVLAFALLAVSYVGIILSYVCYYRIFQEYSPHDTTFFTCMAVIFGMGGTLAFAIRNWPPVTGGAPFFAPVRPPASMYR